MSGLLLALALFAGADETDGVTVAVRWLAPPLPGKEAKLAFDFKVKEGFYFYGKKQGDVGKPLKLKLAVPAGYKVGAGAFPPTKEKTTEFGTDFVYDQSVVLEYPVGIPADAKPSDAAKVSWKGEFQFCKETCFVRPLNGELPVFGGGVATPLPANPQVKLPDAGPAPPAIPDYKFVGVDGAEEAPVSLSWALIAAFLGGVLLNVMPCVLPVIAIKALSFVQHAGESRARLLALNAAYAAGVLAVFAGLATLAVAANKGWGSQFQSPLFTLAMACLIFALALSLLGVYEIPLPGFVGSAAGKADEAEGLAGSFLGGAMTTVLATPCTGPFVGTVLAWSAQQKSTPLVYAIWLTIGLGMASPYLLTAIFPGLLRWLPKPGAWMETFKQVSGFILLATVVFLIGLGGRNPLPILTLLVGMGFALWCLGKHNTILTGPAARWRNRAIAALAIAAAGGIHWLQVAPHEPVLPWEKFSLAALEDARKAGKPALIDFTADWCVNCKVNYKVAIDTAATLEEVQRRGIVCLLADKTADRPDIDGVLEKWRGSTDISTVVVLAPQRPGEMPKGVLLTGLFTQGQMLAAIDAALGK